MKKLAFSVFAAALTFGANAAESVETAPAASESCCGYDGFYFGLGIAGVNGGIKTETTDLYRLGGGRWDNEIGVDSDDHDTKFAGTVTLGYGRRIKEKAYIGLEAGLDATKNSNFVHAGNISVKSRRWEVFSKVNGLTPSVALKLGYVHPGTRGMVYLKAGAAYSVVKADYKQINPDNGHFFASPSGKVSKWSPIIALGGEKLCGKNLRTRLEVEYRFSSNKKFDFEDGAKTDPDYYNGTVKVTNKDTITLRAMAIYTVRM
ncbi:MAG: hypothetical protein J6P84_00665 [Alphaproteobacteria bacterium]|nr:hypothetical protein [Alphaproteobacteria bacterium]